jgi:hypothetical protein
VLGIGHRKSEKKDCNGQQWGWVETVEEFHKKTVFWCILRLASASHKPHCLKKKSLNGKSGFKGLKNEITQKLLGFVKRKKLVSWRLNPFGILDMRLGKISW